MHEHHVRVHRSDEELPRHGQLAHALAEVAADPVEIDGEVAEMVVNRVLDNAAVATQVAWPTSPTTTASQRSWVPPGVPGSISATG